MLQFRAVGDASAFVRCQNKVIWTSTRHAHAPQVVGRDQAQVRAASIVVLARIVVVQLSERMIHVNIIRSMRRVAEDLVVLAGELVGPHDGLEVPVGPVEVVVHDAQSKDMWSLIGLQNNMLVFSVEVGVGHVVQVSVGPPDLVGEVVNGQGVGPSQLVVVNRGNDSAESSIVSVHAKSANVSLEMPGSEENVSNSRMNRNGSGVLNARHQGLSVAAVQLRYAHVLGVPVHPIQFRIDPINSDAFKTFSIMLNHRFTVGDVILANLGLENGLGCNISKINIPIFVMVIQADDISQFSLYEAHLLGIIRHVPDVVLVAEDDPRLNIVQSFARVAIWFAFIVGWIAFA